jgi:uncharacterized protein (TIGR00369 family)
MDALIQQYIENNYFGKLVGMSFNILNEGEVEYKLEVEDKHLATPLNVHGGVIASLIDACMGVGALSAVSKYKQVVSTLECKISFFETVKSGSILHAKSKIIKQGKKILFMEAEVYDSSLTIAKGSGTFKAYSAERAGYKF